MRIVVACWLAVAVIGAAQESRAKNLLKTAHVNGGIVVHAGCRDGRLTARLRVNDRYVVQGLTSAAGLGAVRKVYHEGVSFAAWDGTRLPYVDGLVNLVVVDNAPKLSKEEILRVLAPNGVGLTVLGKVIVRKKRPVAMDEWTHDLHDPTNNAVSKDTIVAPPRRAQWVAGPRYSRHHDKMSSVSAVVSTGGRVFTIIDEGPLWSILAPPRWALTARDAYNGKLLWRRSIPVWHNHLQRLKSGPASLPRRLVAKGDRVYATLALDAAVSQIDAVTGTTLQVYKGTEGTTEILLDGDVLYLVSGVFPAKDAWYVEAQRTLMAVAVDTGKVMWQRQAWVVPGTLAVSGGNVYFFKKDKVACWARETGVEMWESAQIPRPKHFPSCYTPTLVATPNVIVISGGEASGEKVFGRWSTQGAKDTISGLDAKTGKTLWSAHHGDSGYHSPEDVFVIDGKVWFGDSRDGARPGNTYGLDLMTGKIEVKFPPDRKIYFFHHRCHRGKATENYLLPSRAGIEYVDFRNKHWDVNHWVRGACLYGIMPANGLTYAPQHPCACYLETKLDGFNALAPANGKPRYPAALPPRLERGPAYGACPMAQEQAGKDDWPTFRHDIERSGVTAARVPGSLKQRFSVNVGGRLSSPVVGNGLVIVAAIDRHRVHAFTATDGKPAWTFIAGGRVDSPPTIHGNLVLFGCKDGYLYCLRLRDGQLVWRFRGAPVDERMLAYEQLESVWPMHGSVLIHDNVVYASAGRSNFLDGGVRMLRLDVMTGKLLSELVMDGRKQEDGKDQQDYVTWLNMPPGRTDILSCSNNDIYMGSQAFNFDGSRQPLKAKPWNGVADGGAPPPEQDAAHAHLFAPTGFLDDTGWHRTYWVYGSDFYSGWQGYATAGRATPAGKILVADEKTVYGFGRLPQYWKWTTPLEFQIFAAPRSAVGLMKNGGRRKKKGKKLAESAPGKGYMWTKRYPVLVRALVKAGDTIFIAGPRDVFDETKRGQEEQASAQVAAWEGKSGALLLAISAEDGSKTAEYALNAVPRFDGLIAAGGRLYITTTDGRIACWSGE